MRKSKGELIEVEKVETHSIHSYEDSSEEHQHACEDDGSSCGCITICGSV